MHRESLASHSIESLAGHFRSHRACGFFDFPKEQLVSGPKRIITFRMKFQVKTAGLFPKPNFNHTWCHTGATSRRRFAAHGGQGAPLRGAGAPLRGASRRITKAYEEHCDTLLSFVVVVDKFHCTSSGYQLASSISFNEVEWDPNKVH